MLQVITVLPMYIVPEHTLPFTIYFAHLENFHRVLFIVNSQNGVKPPTNHTLRLTRDLHCEFLGAGWIRVTESLECVHVLLTEKPELDPPLHLLFQALSIAFPNYFCGLCVPNRITAQ